MCICITSIPVGIPNERAPRFIHVPPAWEDLRLAASMLLSGARLRMLAMQLQPCAAQHSCPGLQKLNDLLQPMSECQVMDDHALFQRNGCTCARPPTHLPEAIQQLLTPLLAPAK